MLKIKFITGKKIRYAARVADETWLLYRMTANVNRKIICK